MNRISISMTTLVPLMFTGWLVTAPGATAGSPETTGPAATSMEVHASLPAQGSTPGALAMLLTAGTGSARTLLESNPELASVPGLLCLAVTEATRGDGTGSADTVPRIVSAVLRLLELVRQVPLPIPR
ncbi:hypothetical protein [Nocardia australiensis]|uniref:hypothetical protein n=1 Tax=Nocardia australiensis TaxID=2887191 RepID=UPI001D15CE9C|nr:hypothetical protein [Nocardia australiensis]